MHVATKSTALTLVYVTQATGTLAIHAVFCQDVLSVFHVQSMHVATKSTALTLVYVTQATGTLAIHAVRSIIALTIPIAVTVMLTVSILGLEGTIVLVLLVTQEMGECVWQLTLVRGTMAGVHLTPLCVITYNLERVTVAVFPDFTTLPVVLVVH